MATPLLYDAVTLRHFAAVGRLDVCEIRNANLPPPHWSEAVRDEIARHAGSGAAECDEILVCTWLDVPKAPAAADLKPILKLQTALRPIGAGPRSNAGEAESIYFAQQLGGSFATDDNAAFAFAERRLGVGRVLDSVSILHDAVVAGGVSATDALGIANDIRACGRSLRRVHPPTFTTAHFI